MSTNGLKWGDLPATMPTTSIPPRSAVALPDSADDDERRRWIEMVRAEVEAVTYHVDSLAVADRLIERGVLDPGDEQ
jgi:hypothetical protein